MNLKEIQRPSRYINSEINAIKKDRPEVSVALAFPDIYDVGMSHLGMRILYQIVNSIPWARAERAFHPWLDMEAAMRRESEVLRSLESGTPLREFDLVGFSLQYELCYTSVLNMLDLSGIPVRRGERAEGHPVVIGGGPCTVNPLPMSPFLDAQLIGDGEDAVVEIVEAARQHKAGGGGRDALLKALAGIEGLYVPSVHDGSRRIRRRIVSSLEDAPVPTSPVVPYAEIIHDRVAVEVSRGCAMGCRYCQAGMIYRPVRERSPGRVLDIASESIRNTGYSEIAFVSLSAGDYPCLPELIKGFNRRFSESRIGVSLPSLRVAAVNEEVLSEIRSVRKTGFTIAPEAATARLRSVINKDFSAEDYGRALEMLFREGWHNLKLYFMIGLPTETDEDIESIPAMVSNAIKTAKGHSRRHANISVSVSPFVPKAHTPFQWNGQVPMEYMIGKKAYLMKKLKRANFRGHDAETSMLEAAFARAGEDAAALVEAAWRGGARLDGWTEAFDYAIWTKAMEKSGVDAPGLAAREFGLDEPLPWDFVDTGIKKEFLKREHERAMSEETTPDCISSCTACGLRCRSEGEASDRTEASGFVAHPHAQQRPRTPRTPIKVRARFRKSGPMRMLGHRELMTHFTRAINRAGIVPEYTQGFSPAPKLSFGPPLGVGVAGESEYFDMELQPLVSLSDIKERLNRTLGEGMEVLDIAPVPIKAKAVQGIAARYIYDVICPGGSAPGGLQEFVRSGEFVVQREKGAVDLRPMVEEASDLGGGHVRLTLLDTGEKKVRLDEIMQAVLGMPASALDITRTAIFGKAPGGGWAMPHEPDLHGAGAKARAR